MKILKNRKAVSPVIATVILVAVAITIAVAVAYWMSGISGQYTRFEKLELTSAYCEYEGDLNANWNSANFSSGEDGWIITLDFRNTGTVDSSIINVFVNSKKADKYGLDEPTTGFDLISCWEESDNRLDFPNGEKLVVQPGDDDTIYVVIDDDDDLTFTSGTTIEVMIASGAGNNYMKMVTLS